VARGALVLAVVLCLTAGCGSSEPHLGRADVTPLIALANQIGHEGPCAQKRDLARLRSQAIGLVNRHAVPPDLQETFLSGVNDLAGRAPACAPPPPPAPAPEPAPGKHDQGKHNGDGKGHGKHDQGDEG
jgi:hypothetical protein